MLPNFPKQFGFLVKLDDLKGKTIEDIGMERMEWGSTHDHCIFIRFTDGSRAFLLGRNGDVAVGPDVKAYEGRFFTPEEYGQVQMHIKRRADERQAEERRDKEQRLEQLKKDLGV